MSKCAPKYFFSSPRLAGCKIGPVKTLCNKISTAPLSVWMWSRFKKEPNFIDLLLYYPAPRSMLPVGLHALHMLVSVAVLGRHRKLECLNVPRISVTSHERSSTSHERETFLGSALREAQKWSPDKGVAARLDTDWLTVGRGGVRCSTSIG